MGISIDRLAMEIVGKPKYKAEYHLELFGFSPAERSEITAVFSRGWNADFSAITWQSIAKQIKKTMQCSLEMDDRINMNI